METSHPAATLLGQRRNEDIALDLMKFIAGVTDIGRAGAVGFQSGGAKGQEQAEKLLELYGKCLHAVQGKK